MPEIYAHALRILCGRLSTSFKVIKNTKGRLMILDLNDYWYLSNEFSRLRRGPIVLVNKESREVYGPGDLVLVEPSGEFIRAVRVLDRILQSREKILTEEERVFARNFFLG